MQEEAKEAFKELLVATNVSSEWTWEATMRKIIADPRCACGGTACCLPHGICCLEYTKQRTLRCHGVPWRAMAAYMPCRAAVW